MDTYSIVVIELLAIGRESDGRGRIELGMASPDRRSRLTLEIDGYTYRHLESLTLMAEGRMRLSPYVKWDPYRNTFYGTLVRTGDASRETLYFACSEAFKTQLEQIRTGRELDAPSGDNENEKYGTSSTFSGVPPEPRSQEAQPERSAAASRVARRRGSPQTGGRIAVRSVVLGVLLIGLCIWFASGRFGSGSARPEGHAGAMPARSSAEAAKAADLPADAISPKEAPANGTVQAAKFDPDTIVPATSASDRTEPEASSGSSPEDSGGGEMIEIDGKESFYGLPKAYVALTFDDGPSAYTEKIVDILREHDVAATFLFIGQNVKKHPDAVAYASKHGMSIGNHSWDHSVMTKASREEQLDNLAKTSEIIESLTDIPVTLFRPPYGAIDDGLIASAKEQKLKVLLWNRDPEDWHAKRAEDILKYFREVKTPGGVYVLHEDKRTVEALPQIIEYLQKNRLKFAAFK
ncbi:polysaccharide deacetylase family protein [Cohnella sp. REN36]|uniref:polysaccharide deacetylase family protein n=1 Tax=Cohnella sp. REN36 TaxID=2887347 RepID=UPI001D13457F|nr:polysaccharide deacetylase family protein [Cohnella sp. REN36]MCC3372546.1 polysaccharide deacetylase family protein [Cohnella sp. REN36]